jgi:hypothetical protein
MFQTTPGSRFPKSFPVGRHPIPRSIPKACTSVQGNSLLRTQHRRIGRRRVEEVPQGLCSRILREEQQARVGRDREDHGRYVQHPVE